MSLCGRVNDHVTLVGGKGNNCVAALVTAEDGLSQAVLIELEDGLNLSRRLVRLDLRYLQHLHFVCITVLSYVDRGLHFICVL